MSSFRKLHHGILFVFSGPSGTGKNTLMHQILEEFPDVVESVSYTTRKPRENEEDGIHYHFVTEQQFKQRIAEGQFLEYAYHFGNYYGTSRKWVEQVLAQGKHVFLVIDTEGALSIKNSLQTISIFVAPPSFSALQKRLRDRQAESEKAIVKRLERAEKELKDSQLYDYLIVNDDLNDAYDVLRSIVVAETHCTYRLADWPPTDFFSSTPNR